MISKCPKREADKPDNFTGLAEYIAAAKKPGEKLDTLWISNCNAGEDLDRLKYACYEVEAIRRQKPEIAEKTYHFVVSFRPGDREKLSADALKDIEREFAKALGFDEHQRVAGTHIDTDHYHMHVAVNKVHPRTLRMRTPYNDYLKRDRVCRAMEQKYDLVVDRGIDRDGARALGQAARDFEARTWQQSFERHIRENKTEILAGIKDASSWEEVHGLLAGFDAGIKRHGAGLVFYHLGGDKSARVKASSLDRSCSLKALQDRFGPYEPSPYKNPERDVARSAPPEPRQPYTARPLIRHPGQERLWRLFRQDRRPPGFLARNVFNIHAWKDYLMADAHKDALAMAIIVSYRELLHSLEISPPPRTHAPKSIVPALRRWFHELPWETPDVPLLHPGYLAGVGMKIDGDNRVVLPLRDSKGRSWGLRAIDPQGRICNMGDLQAAPPGLRHVLDRRALLDAPSWTGPVIVTTSCTAAAHIHKKTNMPVVIAAREKDLAPLAAEMRGYHPDTKIFIVSALYPETAAKAAQAVDGKTAMPDAAIAEAAAWWTETAAAKGHAGSVDRATAEAMGAFEDDALSLGDVIAARPVLAELDRKRIERAADHATRAASAGHIASVDRRTADAMGAFEEDALPPEEARDSVKRPALGEAGPAKKGKLADQGRPATSGREPSIER